MVQSLNIGYRLFTCRQRSSTLLVVFIILEISFTCTYMQYKISSENSVVEFSSLSLFIKQIKHLFIMIQPLLQLQPQNTTSDLSQTIATILQDGSQDNLQDGGDNGLAICLGILVVVIVIALICFCALRGRSQRMVQQHQVTIDRQRQNFLQYANQYRKLNPNQPIYPYQTNGVYTQKLYYNPQYGPHYGTPYFNPQSIYHPPHPNPLSKPILSQQSTQQLPDQKKQAYQAINDQKLANTDQQNDCSKIQKQNISKQNKNKKNKIKNKQKVIDNDNYV